MTGSEKFSDGQSLANSIAETLAHEASRFTRTTMYLKCPGCLHEFTCQTQRSFDARIKFDRYAKTSEVRELREAWCESRRSAFRKVRPVMRCGFSRCLVLHTDLA